MNSNPFHVLIPIVAIATAACGGGSDAASRELLAISHTSSEPNGSMSISDDGTFEYIDGTTKKVVKGSVSQAKLENLNAVISEGASKDLEPFRAPDDSVCLNDPHGYIIGLNNPSSTACFVVSEVDAPEARTALDFFVSLFEMGAQTK